MKNILAILSILALAATGNGQSCQIINGRVVNCAPAVTHRAVVVDQVAVTEVIVPVFTPLAVVIDPRISYLYHGGGYGSAPQPQAQAQAVKPALKPRDQGPPDIDRLIDQIERRVRERASKPGPPAVPGFKPAVKIAQQSPRNYGDVLATHCAACHTGASSKGGFTIFSAPGQFAADWNAQAVWDAIAGGRMPPAGRPRVGVEDRSILERDFGLRGGE